MNTKFFLNWNYGTHYVLVTTDSSSFSKVVDDLSDEFEIFKNEYSSDEYISCCDYYFINYVGDREYIGSVQYIGG